MQAPCTPRRSAGAAHTLGAGAMYSTTVCWCCAQMISPHNRSSAQGPRPSWSAPGLTANPQHTLDPSWSVRLLAAPRRVRSAVFLGSPPTCNTLLVPPAVCAAPGRSSPCKIRGFPGLTANPQHTLDPSWSLRLLAAPRSVGPAVSRAHRQPATHAWSPPGVCGSWPLLAVGKRFS